MVVMLAHAGVAHAQSTESREDDAVEEVGPSPVYYRLPEIAPTAYLHGGPSFAIDCVAGATAWGFRLGGGVALAVARDPHHVVAIEAGYAYRGFDDHVGSIGLAYLFTDADEAADVTLQPGIAVSAAVIGGGRPSDVGVGARVAIAFRFIYSLELAYEWLSTGNGVLQHVVSLTVGGSGVAW